MVDQGIPAVVSTDAFVQSYKPFDAIHAAVNRISSNGTNMGAEQRITLLEAIRAYTYDAAYSVYHEKHKGSIEAGKAADIAVVAGDLLTTEPLSIDKQEIYLTMVDGETLYKKAAV